MSLFHHTSALNRRGRAGLFCVLIVICQLFGCANDTVTQPSGDPMMMTVTSVQEVATNGYFDTILGVYAQEDSFLAVGKKGDALLAARIGRDGALSDPLSPEIPADATDRLFTCGTDKDGGLMLVYESAKVSPDGSACAILAHYDEEGHISDTATLGGIEAPCHGVMRLSSGAYLLWNTDGATVCTGNQSRPSGPPPEGGYFLSFFEDNNSVCFAIVLSGSMGICTFDPESAGYGGVDYFRGFIRSEPIHISTVSRAVYANAGDFFYQYHVDTKEWKERFAWSATALDGEMLSSMAELDENSFAAVFGEDNTIYLIRTELQKEERKEVIIGALGDRLVQLDRLVALFNSRSENYYATVKYYDEVNVLLADLVTDNAPDLLEISNVQIPLSPDKFEDILPYLDRDDRIGQKDLVEGMLRAQMVDGHLTSLAASAWMMTLVGAEKEVGQTPGWTLEELKKAAAGMEEGGRIFPEWMTAEQMLYWVSTVSLGRFIDWDTMQCSFDSEEFMELLAFCAEMPLVEDMSTYTSDFDDRILLQVWPLQRLLLLENLYQVFSGDNYTFIGFPNEEGKTGSFFEPAEMEVMFAIPMRSGQKEGAWEVIREMLLPEYQKTVTFLPINRHVMEAGVEELLQNPELHITREAIDKALSVINQTDIYIHYHMQIYDIIVEEGMSYLYGEKSAEEVAKLIQSRVGLYLEEHK